MYPVFPDGKVKCLTMSFDDGVVQDRRLVELFNKYNIKGTFNLDSGAFECSRLALGNFPAPVEHKKIAESEVKDLYKGHEVAVHTLTHPHLEYCSRETVAYEIHEDRLNLERLVGYPVVGMAYPYGTWNDTVVDEAKKQGICYSRTTVQTKTFAVPENFMEWHPTVHFGDSSMPLMTQRFLDDEGGGRAMGMLRIYYIWGHSYELDGYSTWDLMEDTLAKLSGLPDVWYATNIEIFRYVEAVRNVIKSADGSMLVNPSAIPVWFMADGKPVCIKSGETVRLG